METTTTINAVAATAAHMKRAQIQEAASRDGREVPESIEAQAMIEAYKQASIWFRGQDPHAGWVRQMARNSYTIDPKEPERDTAGEQAVELLYAVAKELCKQHDCVCLLPTV